MGGTWLVAVIAATLASAAAPPERQRNPVLPGGQNLEIRLYDLAPVPPATLDAAVTAVADVLFRAGIKTHWPRPRADHPEAHYVEQSASPRTQPDRRQYVVVRIVQEVPASIYPRALGCAFPRARAGAHATIFYGRVCSLPRPRGVSLATVLGYVMAHEIGHVLVRSGHSDAGIMKGRWNNSDWLWAAKRRLQFSGSEAREARKAAQERCEGTRQASASRVSSR